MFADARNFQQQIIDTDICIVGAGPAGITLARNFSGSSVRVLLIESGGLTFERSAQKLAKGINAGLPYEALNLCRVRKFGGSTGRMGWGGWCKPFAELDFALRPWVPMSGWPISRKDLQPYYLRALTSLDLPPYTYDPDLAESRARDDKLFLDETPLTVEESLLAPTTGQYFSGAADALKVAENITVLLHATATEIVSDAQAGRVTGLKLKSLSGRDYSVTARWIVLAAGAIENPRLLLQSNTEHARGIGNDHDLVGRCFMEHPRFTWGRLSGSKVGNIIRQLNPAFVVPQRLNSASASPPVIGMGLMVRPEIQQEEQILNARTWIMPAPAIGEGQGGRALKEAVFWLKKLRMPDAPLKRAAMIASDLPNAINTAICHLLPTTHWQFVTITEQEPILKSRVTLDHRRDALGQNIARLEWHLGPLVERTLRRNQDMIVATLSKHGFDCAATNRTQSKEFEPELVRWVWHHMGTTRMSTDPAQGVVDSNCRVHGVDNLYVTGSSVFPTGGNDMPTLTIVALAHRLADHIKERIAISAGSAATLMTGASQTAAVISEQSKDPELQKQLSAIDLIQAN